MILNLTKAWDCNYMNISITRDKTIIIEMGDHACGDAIIAEIECNKNKAYEIISLLQEAIDCIDDE